MAKGYQDLKLEISQKKIELHKTDNDVILFVEGVIDSEEFEKVKKQRESLRDEIEKLEKKLPAAKKAYEAELKEKEEIEEQEE